MQPYFLPYLGYFQLMNAVDEFVIYDNIKYTKKGWINRNRFLLNEKDELFSVALKKGSDSLDVREREISPIFERDKLLNQFKSAYVKAPYFESAMSVISKIILFQENNLFEYIFNSIKIICIYLNIQTKIIISSTIRIDHSNLKAQDKVIAICKELKSDTYINPIGGLELYNKEVFDKNEVKLYFLKMEDVKYTQFGQNFIPNLSILDVLMFNSKEQVTDYLSKFNLT